MLIPARERPPGRRSMRMPMTPVSRLTRSIRLRTVRSRFTALYGVVFFLSGAGLLVIANVVTLGSRQVTHAVPGPEPAPPGTELAVAREQITWLQTQLAEQHAAQARQVLAGSAIAL